MDQNKLRVNTIKHMLVKRWVWTENIVFQKDNGPETRSEGKGSPTTIARGRLAIGVNLAFVSSWADFLVSPFVFQASSFESVLARLGNQKQDPRKNVRQHCARLNHSALA